MKKTIVLVLALVVVFAFSIVVSARDNQFQLAPKEKLAQFYEVQFNHLYNYIPADVLQKHSATIAKVDKKIKDERIAGAITSKTPQFDLNYYGHIISIGILPYVDQNDPFGKELRELVSDIDKHTIDYQRLEKFNKAHYGDEMPAPTTLGESTVGDMVKISLNGSGYNITKAVNYARAWTQNGVELRNQNYSYYNGLNDCTNFVSQVLHDASAGTIPYIHIDTWLWDYDDPDNWYYSNNGWPDRPSWTWGGAHNQYWHLANWSSNVRRLYYWSDVRVGDVVMWDTNPNDGVFHIGHNSVVTKIQNGTIYLTYHTTDKEDEPITTFFNAGYIGYAWAINH